MKKALVVTVLLLFFLLLSACVREEKPTDAVDSLQSETNGSLSSDIVLVPDSSPENGQISLPETTSLPDTGPEISFSDFSVPKTMGEVRARVIDYFNELAAVKWRCKETMDFRQEASYTTNLIYYRGQDYYGIPYTARRLNKACLIEFSDHLSTAGVYIGPTDYGTLVGGDCGSMRTAWAWGGAVYGVGMSYYAYEYFENPKETRNRVKGFIVPVGDFDYSHYDYTLPFSECIFPYNDLDSMCKSYAELKACDVIGKRWVLAGSIAQHLRMIVEDATIVRNGAGTIVPQKSYIVYSEQTSTPRTIDGKNTTWQLNVKVSFRSLYDEGYIPMTNTCLKSEKVEEPAIVVQNEGVLTGIVGSNYNVFVAEATVTDENGNVVIYAKNYPYALEFDVAEMPFEKTTADLPAGNYRFTLKITIGFGTKTVIDRPFEKDVITD